MELSKYFGEAKGSGILATADSEGKVDVAVYARPHFLDDGSLAFIMRDRLSYQNLQSNPQAAYMFIEDKPGHAGLRIYLKKTKEDSDPEIIDRVRRSCSAHHQKHGEEQCFLVHFSIEKTRPLVGDNF